MLHCGGLVPSRYLDGFDIGYLDLRHSKLRIGRFKRHIEKSTMTAKILRHLEPKVYSDYERQREDHHSLEDSPDPRRQRLADYSGRPKRRGRQQLCQEPHIPLPDYRYPLEYRQARRV